uniref:Receptor for retinol uptake STRA6 n=1 Tax=Catharus ustulatus TaxID=91951 RepID=A0A8C3UPJ3_CATUS
MALLIPVLIRLSIPIQILILIPILIPILILILILVSMPFLIPILITFLNPNPDPDSHPGLHANPDPDPDPNQALNPDSDPDPGPSQSLIPNPNPNPNPDSRPGPSAMPDPDPFPAFPEFWKILALLYYPVFYAPLLACASPRHRLGYAAGALLAWAHCAAQLGHRLQCPLATKIHRLYSLLSDVPILLSLSLLSLWYPVLLVHSLRHGDGSEPEVRTPGIRDWDCKSQNLVSSQVALLLLVAVVPTIQIVRAGMTKDMVVLLVQFGLVPSDNPAVPGDMEKELSTVRHYLWSLEGGIPAGGFGNSGGWNFPRSNLRALYQGAVLDVFSKAHILRPSREAVVCWIAFSSFQAAFCLGTFPIFWNIPSILGHSWRPSHSSRPFWLTLVVAVLVQHLLARFQFLEQHSLQKELTNRRALYIVTFLLFPINVLVGVLAGVWRVVISGLYNAIHLCRLDISLLQRGVETFDPGYHTYCHYLKVEVSQCHPLLRAFCSLLLQPGRNKPPAAPRDTHLEEGLQLMHPKHPAPGKARIQRIRARWWVAYTLLHNPSLTASRKTALADPAANGAQLGIPRP